MLRCVTGIVLAGLLVAAAPKTDSKTALKELQGTWVLDTIQDQKSGDSFITSDKRAPTVRIEGDKLESNGAFGEKMTKGTITLDTSYNPARITIKTKDKTSKGVYKVTKNRLAIYLGEKDYPTTLEHKKGGEGQILGFHKKKK